MIKNILRYVAAALMILMCWVLLFVLISRPVVPSPLVVFSALPGIFMTKIDMHMLYSFWRLFVSMLLSVAIGFPLGMIAGYYQVFDRFFSPLLYFLYPIPKIAFLPVIMLLMGLGEGSKIFILLIIVVFQITVTVRDGIRALDPRVYYPLIALNASSSAIFAHILIPASIPRLLSALRVALATSLSVLFFAETFGTVYGLGYFIMDAMFRINYVEMYCGIIILSVMGVVLFALLDLTEKVVVKWNKV